MYLEAHILQQALLPGATPLFPDEVSLLTFPLPGFIPLPLVCRHGSQDPLCALGVGRCCVEGLWEQGIALLHVQAAAVLQMLSLIAPAGCPCATSMFMSYLQAAGRL